MKRLFLLMFLLLSTTAYAENKIYFDAKSGKEVVDIDGKKTIAQINKEFNGDFVDVTQDRKDADSNAQAAADQKDSKRKTDRTSAINKLRALGFTPDEISIFVQ